MENTNRDHTEEGRDRDDLGNQTIPPPPKHADDDSGHVPGGATEMAELARRLQPAVGGKAAPDKATGPGKASPAR